MTHPSEKHLTSALVHAGRRELVHTPIANTPVYRASTVLFDSMQQAIQVGAQVGRGERHASSYGTVATSTTFALIDALCEIEGRSEKGLQHSVRAVLAPSGLAAITVALLAYLKPGDHVLMSDAVYGPARVFAQGMLARMGIATTFFLPEAQAAELNALVQANTRVLFLESPSSYTMELHDTPALCAWARSKGILSMIDNTWATPCFASPFDWGVDVSLSALTKYWSGHSDVLMGGIVVREEHWLALWTAYRQLGICVSSDDAFLVLRGLRTAQVRMQQHERNALQIAQWLEAQKQVTKVLYPALPSHPQHALWKRDFSGASGLLSFELAASVSQEQAMTFVNQRKRFGIGYSWGGFESLMVLAQLAAVRSLRPWTGGALIRINIGLDEPQDLMDDLAQGFAVLAG